MGSEMATGCRGDEQGDGRWAGATLGRRVAGNLRRATRPRSRWPVMRRVACDDDETAVGKGRSTRGRWGVAGVMNDGADGVAWEMAATEGVVGGWVSGDEASGGRRRARRRWREKGSTVTQTSGTREMMARRWGSPAGEMRGWSATCDGGWSGDDGFAGVDGGMETGGTHRAERTLVRGVREGGACRVLPSGEGGGNGSVSRGGWRRFAGGSGGVVETEEGLAWVWSQAKQGGFGEKREGELTGLGVCWAWGLGLVKKKKKGER